MGVRCDGYELLDDPGEGELVRARSVDGEAVALRVSGSERARWDEERARLEARFQAMRARPHPNRVAALDRGVDPELGPYLVTAWTDGMALDEAVPDRRGLPPEAVALLLEPVIDALAELHRGGVAHGGVTADAVRVTARAEVTLIDPRPVVDDEAAAQRDDVAGLGALLGVLLGDAARGSLAHLAQTCVAEDPAARPADATVVLARIRPSISTPRERRRDARVALLTDPRAFDARAFLTRGAPSGDDGDRGEHDRDDDDPDGDDGEGDGEANDPGRAARRREIPPTLGAIAVLTSVLVLAAVTLVTGLQLTGPTDGGRDASRARAATDAGVAPSPPAEERLVPIPPDALSNDDPPLDVPGADDPNREAELRAALASAERGDAPRTEGALGLHLLALGRTRDAYRALIRAHRDAPEDVGTMQALLLVYERAGREADALPLIRRWVETTPDDAEAWTTLSVALAERDDVRSRDDAIGAVERAAQLDPTHARALRHRCLLFSRLAQPGTVRACDEAVLRTPRDPELFLARAEHLGREGRHHTAIADADRAIELAPDRAESYLVRARLRFDAGSTEGAEQDRRIACGLDEATCGQR